MVFSDLKWRFLAIHLIHRQDNECGAAAKQSHCHAKLDSQGAALLIKLGEFSTAQGAEMPHYSA